MTGVRLQCRRPHLTEAEWDELFPGEAYRVTCPEFTAGE